MKITNLLPTGSITFATGDGPVTVRAGETSDDLRVKPDDPIVVANRNAGNITLSGRGAPREDEAAKAEPAKHEISSGQPADTK